MALRRGLERLPQELYYEIYEHVFTAPQQHITVNPPKDTKNISKPFSHLLRVDRRSRARFAASYY